MVGDTPLSIAALAGEIAGGAISPVDLVDGLLERIARLNPTLNAYLSLNPRARLQARAADRAVRAGRRLGPLHGVPVSVKDLILTRGLPTTAGSRAFGTGLPGEADAPIVRRLRSAGAILLGKTNLHEIAMGVTSENEHFGPVRNPWDIERVAGGSSGGSAAAVAAGLDWGSIGTDTRGSIRIPAACCGVTGLKPTYGLVPTEGVFPLSPSLDHAGPIARSVEDSALLLAALVSGARRRERLIAAPRQEPTPLRIGFCPWFFEDIDPPVERLVRAAAAVFREAGHTLVEVEIPGLAEAHAGSGVITGAEALAMHESTLREHPEGYGPSVQARLARAESFTAVDLVRAEQAQAEIVTGFTEVFGRVDCLLTPTLPALPPLIGAEGVTIGGRTAHTLNSFTRLTSPMNMAGVPALTLPCGLHAGLPVGLQLAGPWGMEERLLQLGAWYQRQTLWHEAAAPV